MKLTRPALVLATTALAPALLLAAPAVAAPPATAASAASAVTAAPATDEPTTPVDEMSEEELRLAILRIMAKPESGRGVARDANRALNGTVEDMRAFLRTGYRVAQTEDDRVAILTLLAGTDNKTDKAVIREINKVLNDNSPEAPEHLRAFLETGYRLARAEDDRYAIFLIVIDEKADKALRAAAEKALNGTPEEMRYFLEHGRYEV
ncbi:ALF repeat-containing protein [Streptomyces sp. NPDC014734]|uniref:ALF repeat-containing protein n=1 Tax=Streptomyces sp. NPDC014734 TaxID=3364886 RepID=UPI0036FA9E77